MIKKILKPEDWIWTGFTRKLKNRDEVVFRINGDDLYLILSKNQLLSKDQLLKNA